ncbi:MAG TPA: ABC-type transport auxiliary lipoprotein family protein [Rhizomicrobium sp.]|nr:ABC-type transport auxiliary lipoprotein family protein [Rhizomicrobium sp.]
MNDQTRRHLLFTGASLFALSGCSSLHLLEPSQELGRMYVLSPNVPVVAGAQRPSWQIAVEQPEAPASLSTDRIAIRRGDEMDYFADSQWTDSAPKLLQNFFVEALEKNGVTAATDVAGIHADYILQSELRTFEARYDHGDAAPTVVVDVTVKLMVVRTAEIAASRDFHLEQPASANSVAAAVTAFDQAVAALLGRIVPWVLNAAHQTR